MKTLKELIATWYAVEEQLRALEWAQRVFLNPQFAPHLDALREECGFEDATEEARSLWLAIEKEFNQAEQAVVLLRLCESEVTLADFLAAYASPAGGRSVRRALEIVTSAKPKPAPTSVPIHWRN